MADLFVAVPGTPLSASKANMLVCKVGEVVKKVEEIRAEIEELIKTGINNLLSTIAKFSAKMEKLIKESKIYNYSKRSLAKIEKYRDRFEKTITQMIHDIVAFQQKLFKGIESKLQDLTKDIKGVKVTSETDFSMDIQMKEMKLPTLEDPTYESLEVDLNPDYKFNVDVEPDLEGLLSDCNVSLMDNYMKSMITVTPGAAPVVVTA